jgi:Sugar diacid utilization regulator
MLEQSPTNSTKKDASFLLNLLILADSFDERFNIINLITRTSKPTLKGVRHYRTTPSPQKGYIYLVDAKDVSPLFKDYHEMHFIIIGEVDTSLFSNSASLIALDKQTDPIDVFDYTLQIFAEYMTWDLDLQRAVSSDNPINDMLKASLEIFKNPIFLHDNDFYILACPKYIEGMTIWEIDPRTGRSMVPLNVINDLKIDTEYTNTLNTHHVDMFSANQRGYRILYNNLWNENHCDGRICVNELQTLIKPGHYIALEYLSKMVLSCLIRRNTFRISMGHDVEHICKQILQRELTEEREIKRLLRFLDWNANDTYLVIKLGTEHVEMNHRFTTSAFGYIESQIAASHSFFYDEGIVAIVNLSASQSTPSQAISNLSFLVREGLFKIGVSNPIDSFFNLPEAYSQSSIALEYGNNSTSMIWVYHFHEYVLDYMFDKICSDLPYDFICANHIQELQKYDNKHNTKLNETLETYLHLERNVVQTAKSLYIHRSTLFYRLERIQKIVNIDLNDAKMRLYLEISYHMCK